MILVDDFSPDDSWKAILELAETNPRVRGIRLSKNYGQQNATYAGLHYASGEVIVTLDDDLQHEPEHIPSLIDALQNEETDLVYGVFSTRQDGEHRALGSKLTAYFFKKRFKVLAGQRVSSFRAFRASVKNAVIGKESGFVYIS
ncbi:glycosyltransferase, partial [Aduncisulcus paluster]